MQLKLTINVLVQTTPIHSGGLFLTLDVLLL